MSAQDTQDKDIVVNATNAGNYNDFLRMLKTAGMVGTLKGMGPFTVLMPTDRAFSKVTKLRMHELLADKELLTATINLHVIHGKLNASDLAVGESQSAQGTMLKWSGKAGDFTVNGAKVSKDEIEACNGVIHGIDTVMKLTQ